MQNLRIGKHVVELGSEVTDWDIMPPMPAAKNCDHGFRALGSSWPSSLAKARFDPLEPN